MKFSPVISRIFKPAIVWFLITLPFFSIAQDQALIIKPAFQNAIQPSTYKLENETVAISEIETLISDTTILKKINTGRVPEKYTYNKHRVQLATAANIVGYGGTLTALYSSWYSKFPQSNFHTFNDNREWKQVDKVGHAYSAYIESYGSMEMWRWAGLSRKRRIWIGGLSGLVYQTAIETLDGFSAEWGWSWGDFAANVFGSGMLISQELLWDEQRVRFKFSFHRKDYGEPQLNARADELYGENILQRMLKDYNGQTYWLSANLKSFFPKSNLPPWLSLAVGYGAEGMFGAFDNVASDKQGNIIFDRRDIRRYRQFYLSPDIDFSKIRTNSKFLRFTFGFLNAFKFPAPSLEYGTNGKFRFNFIHF